MNISYDRRYKSFTVTGEVELVDFITADVISAVIDAVGVSDILNEIGQEEILNHVGEKKAREYFGIEESK